MPIFIVPAIISSQVFLGRGQRPEAFPRYPEVLISGIAEGSEALFISCTGLRTSGLIDDLEKRLGRPVVTSNQALSWASLRAAGVADRVMGQGRLMREH